MNKLIEVKAKDVVKNDVLPNLGKVVHMTYDLLNDEVCIIFEPCSIWPNKLKFYGDVLLYRFQR